MKLTILTQYFYPEMGAPQSRLLELAKELQLLGWDVEIVTALPNYPIGKIFDAYRKKFSCTETVSGLNVHRYWLYPSRSSQSLPRIISMLSFSATAFLSVFKIRKFRPDFIMVESPPLPLVFSGWLLSKVTGAKIIMNVSDLWPLTAKELGVIGEGFVYNQLVRFENFLYRRAHVCTGQSQEIVDYIRKQKSENVLLLRNGVDTLRFKDELSVKKSNTIIYAGLLGVAQGLLNLCKNVNFKEHNFELHIYGSGNEKEAIFEFLNSNPDKGIFYKGVLSREEIPVTLQRYDASLAPLTGYIYGAVPSKIYEYMAAGLPVLFVGEGEGARIVEEYRVGWVSPSGDWKQVAVNLALMYKVTDAEWYELKMHARQVAKNNFDRKQQVGKLHRELITITKTA